MEQVEKANHEQPARWYRFLPSGDTKEQQKICRTWCRLRDRWPLIPALELDGGWTEISCGEPALR